MDIVPSVFFRDMLLFVCVDFKHSKKEFASCISSNIHQSISLFIYSVQFSHSALSNFLRLHGLQHTKPHCPSPINSWSLLKLRSIASMMPSNHLILCRPLLLLPSIFPRIRVFSNESALCIRWPKYWSFSFSISPSNEYSGLISFSMDWLDLLAVQGTLKSLKHYSSKASSLQWSAFFMVQLSHPYMTTGKTVALTIGTFVGKVVLYLKTKKQVNLHSSLLSPHI